MPRRAAAPTSAAIVRRAAEAYGRAEQRGRALDDADALAVAAVNRALCLVAAGQAPEARAAIDEALADARVSPQRRAELQVAGARAELRRPSRRVRWPARRKR
jgi:ribosome maturation protein Sdo1